MTNIFKNVLIDIDTGIDILKHGLLDIDIDIFKNGHIDIDMA